MSDEDEMIAQARRRDLQRAQDLGDYTPVEQTLATAEGRALLWRDIIDFLARVAESGPDHLAISARDLLKRVHAL
jgi:hypothetical protein